MSSENFTHFHAIFTHTRADRTTPAPVRALVSTLPHFHQSLSLNKYYPSITRLYTILWKIFCRKFKQSNNWGEFSRKLRRKFDRVDNSVTRFYFCGGRGGRGWEIDLKKMESWGSWQKISPKKISRKNEESFTHVSKD